MTFAEVSALLSPGELKLGHRLETFYTWRNSYIACDVSKQLDVHHRDSVLFSFVDLPCGGVHRGLRSLRVKLEFTFEQFPVIADRGDQIYQAGDYLFHRSTPTLRANATGTEFSVTGVNEIRFLDGKIASRKIYVDETPFRAAAGASEGMDTARP